MTKSKFTVFLILLISCLYASCEQYNPAAAPCATYWRVQNPQNISVGITSGNLVFSGATINNGIAARTEFSNQLGGDFVLVMELDNFVPGTGNGAYVQLYLTSPEGPVGNYVSLGMGTSSSLGNGLQLSGAFNPTGSSPAFVNDFTSTPNGIFRIWKTGSNIQIYGYNATDTVVYSADFGTSNILFDVRFGSNNETITNTPSAYIRQISINRGGSIISEQFNCNSFIE